MTDCHICGHPVLEGQPMASEGVIQAANGQFTHQNPADHLPTLAEMVRVTAVAVSDLGEDDPEGFIAVNLPLVRKKERERAAKMVEETTGLTTPDSFAERSRQRHDLAARIRSGD